MIIISGNRGRKYTRLITFAASLVENTELLIGTYLIIVEVMLIWGGGGGEVRLNKKSVISQQIFIRKALS